MTSSLFVNVRAQANGRPYSPAGLIVAVDGTAYPGAPFPPVPGSGAGFSSDLVGGLIAAQDGLWDSVCIGYPASVFPMWPSVQVARGYVVQTLASYAARYRASNGGYAGLAILLSGYSQGSMVMDQVWTQDILPDTGVLHYLLPYVYRIYNFGDPFRCPGIAHGNELAGQPLPPLVYGQITGGIGGPQDLTPAQTNVLAPDGRPVVCSFVNGGDLYADAPTGYSPWTVMPQVERVEYNIFQIVQHATFINVISLAEDLLMPIGTIEGIINAGNFFAQGTNAPHWQYQAAMGAAIQDALALGNSLPHESGY